MSLLEVKHLKKVYTTRFGGAKVEALADYLRAHPETTVSLPRWISLPEARFC